jgi:hypothetical protein
MISTAEVAETERHRREVAEESKWKNSESHDAWKCREPSIFVVLIALTSSPSSTRILVVLTVTKLLFSFVCYEIMILCQFLNFCICCCIRICFNTFKRYVLKFQRSTEGSSTFNSIRWPIFRCVPSRLPTWIDRESSEKGNGTSVTGYAEFFDHSFWRGRSQSWHVRTRMPVRLRDARRGLKISKWRKSSRDSSSSGWLSSYVYAAEENSTIPRAYE